MTTTSHICIDIDAVMNLFCGKIGIKLGDTIRLGEASLNWLHELQDSLVESGIKLEEFCEQSESFSTQRGKLLPHRTGDFYLSDVRAALQFVESRRANRSSA